MFAHSQIYLSKYHWINKFFKELLNYLGVEKNSYLFTEEKNATSLTPIAWVNYRN